MLFEDGRGGLPWLALRDGFRILKANLQMPCGQALLSVSFASSAALEDRTALGYTAQPWLGRPGPTLSGFCPCCRDADTRSETCLSAENVAEKHAVPATPPRAATDEFLSSKPAGTSGQNGATFLCFFDSPHTKRLKLYTTCAVLKVL